MDGGSSSMMTRGSLNAAALADFLASGRLVELLVVVRGLGLAPEAQMHVRDLVLDYALATTPEEKATHQSSIMAALNLTAAAVPASATATPPPNPPVAEPTAQFGAARPAPQFAPAPTPAPASPPPATTPPAPEPNPASETPLVKLAVQPDEGTTQPAPTGKEASEPAPVTPAPADPVSAAKVRVAEIKQAVNSQVGNPVNLMSPDNNIGRDYMNALLVAIKATNGAPAGELERAMQDLESAYQAVEQYLADGGAATAPEREDTPASANKPPAETANATSPAPARPKTPEPTAPTSPTPPEPAPTPPVVPPPAKPPTEKSQPTPAPAPAAAPPVTTPSAPKPSKPSRLAALTAKLMSQPEPTPTSAPATPPTPPPQSVSVPVTSSTPASVADVTATKAAVVQQKQSAAAAAVAAPQSTNQDPLHAPAVNAGLEQLLSEWKLFKSSGIFGTGPSGKDHPLYQSLAALTMSSVVSGRYEGATTEIKQSITDYMNGWRYEHGVVHELGETFEHYLRRVIKKILERQKASNTA